MRLLDRQLNESINDKGILKAVVFIGLPGAGKSTMISSLHDGTIPLMIVSSDSWKEWYKNIYSQEDWKIIGRFVKRHTTSEMIHHINSLLPIYLDTTGSNRESFARRVKILEDFGYDLKLIHVDVDIQTALARVKARVEKGGRDVPEEFIRKVDKTLKQDAQYFKKLIPNYKRIMNYDGEMTKEIGRKASKEMFKFFNAPVRNPLGKKILDFMKKMGYKYYNDIPEKERIEQGFIPLNRDTVEWY